MGKTSSSVKDKYNAKAYDDIRVRLPKGERDWLKEKALSLGYTSVNSFVIDAIKSFQGK